MTIETPRLTLRLLTLTQAELYFLGNNLLEQALHLPDGNRIVDTHFKDVAEKIFLPNLRKDETNAVFYSFFILVETTSLKIVGEIGCHSKPIETGEVEIGYSTQAHFQNKGYMSEAVGSFAKFLLSLDNVKTIIAETEKSNIPSQKVLICNNFIKDNETTENITWKLNKII
ncbi:MAG: GNAT family N-acetyltransferase [Chitinophagales bacterium]|nr:GNAT family N-acetyltransferase [Chitinophagales bacterium]